MIFFRIILKLSNNFSWTLLVFFCFSFMPGTTRNAVLGMENIYAALLIMSLVYLIVCHNLFEKIGSLTVESIFSFISGLSLCLRADAAVIIFFIYFFRILFFFISRKRNQIYFVFISGLSALLIYLSSIFFYFSLADGLLPFSGGLSRSKLSISSGEEIFSLFLNFKIIIRWLAYFPILFGFIYSSYFLLKFFQSKAFSVEKINNNVILAIVLFCSIITYIFLYTFSLFPSGHLSRYLIYYWFLVGIFITTIFYKFQKYQKWKKFHKNAFLFLVLIFTVINISEFFVRFHLLSPGHKLSDLSNAALNREVETNNLLSSLEIDGNTKYPIKVAVVEVQRKFWWDERVSVISLDGILNSKLLNYFQNGYYDHFSYLLDNNVDYILEFPNFNKDKSLPSLRDLQKYKNNTYGSYQNFNFKKISNNIVKIIY